MNRKGKTMLFLAASVLCLLLCVVPAYADTGIVLETKGIQKQDQVYFGQIGPAEDNFFYGTNGSPVGWWVLDNEKSSMGSDGMLLLSKNLYGDSSVGINYSDDPSKNDWESSRVRRLCNSFYNNGFIGKEKGAVTLTKITNDAAKTVQEIPGKESPIQYDASQLSGDYVFSLSADEADRYLKPMTNTQRVGYLNGGLDRSFWWLRSPATKSIIWEKIWTSVFGGNEPATGASYNGIITNGGLFSSINVNFIDTQQELFKAFYKTTHNGQEPTDDNYWNDTTVIHRTGARPAFNLDLNQVVFASAAGKKGTDINGLEVNTSRISSEWELTLKDSSLNLSDAKKVSQNGKKVTVSYAATPGSNHFISAIIKNSQGNVTYYGRLKNVTEANASGTVEIDLSSISMSSSDKLYIFCEEINGNQKTDYAGEFKEIPVSPESETQPETQPETNAPSVEPMIVYVQVPAETSQQTTPSTETPCTEEGAPLVFDAESKVPEIVEARAKGTLAVTKVLSNEKSILLSGATTFQYAKRSETKPDSVIAAKAFAETSAEAITIDLRGSSTRLTFGKNAFSGSAAVKLILRGNVASRFNFKSGAFNGSAIEEIRIRGMKNSHFKTLSSRIKKAGYTGSIVK